MNFSRGVPLFPALPRPWQNNRSLFFNTALQFPIQSVLRNNSLEIRWMLVDVLVSFKVLQGTYWPNSPVIPVLYTHSISRRSHSSRCRMLFQFVALWWSGVNFSVYSGCGASGLIVKYLWKAEFISFCDPTCIENKIHANELDKYRVLRPT